MFEVVGLCVAFEKKIPITLRMSHFKLPMSPQYLVLFQGKLTGKTLNMPCMHLNLMLTQRVWEKIDSNKDNRPG